MAQSVKRLTLNFGSGHDLEVLVSLSPASGSTLTVQSLLGIFSILLSLPLPCLLFLKIIIIIINNLKRRIVLKMQ